MGSKKTPRAPAPPDMEGLIDRQAQVNRVDTSSPFGSTTFSGPNRNRQTTTLSPELQAIFGQAVNQASDPGGGMPFQGRALPSPVADVALNSPGRTTGVGEFQSGTFQPSALDPTAIENALFERQTRLMEPQFAQRERDLRQNLADRGLVEGDEASNNALDMELGQQNRARSDAALSAVLAGRDAFERDRSFDFGTFADQRNFDRSGFDSDRNFSFQGDVFDNSVFNQDRSVANQLNQQDFGNRLALDEGDRAFALNQGNLGLNQDQVQFGQLASLLGLAPNQSISPIDVTGPAQLAQQGQMAQYQGQLQNQQNSKGLLSDVIGGGASLGSSAILMGALSDIRAKKNIRRVGTTSKGFGLYEWEWKVPRPQASVGVIAQEVQSVMPDAVHERNGFLHVDYSKVGTW